MACDSGEKTSSLDRSGANRKQCNQHGYVYEEASGQSNLDNQRKPITGESYNVPPVTPPRERSGQLSQTQGSKTYTRSNDGSEHEHLHKLGPGGVNSHAVEDHGQENQVISADSKHGCTADPENHSTWPVGKNGRPLRAGGENNQAGDICNHGEPSQNQSSHPPRRHVGSSSLRASDDHSSVEGPGNDGIHLSPGDESIRAAQTDVEGSHYLQTNDRNGPPLRAGAESGRSDENRHLSQDKGHYSLQAGYDIARRPLRAGAEGSHSFGADDRPSLPLRAGGESKLSVGSGNDNQHVWEDGKHSSQVGYDSGRHVRPVHDRHHIPQHMGGDSRPTRAGSVGSYPTQTGGDMHSLHGRSAGEYNMQRSDDRNYTYPAAGGRSYQPNQSGFDRGLYHEKEQKYGAPSQGEATKSSQMHAQQRGSGRNSEVSRIEQHHQHSGPNNPLLHHEVLQQSHLNDRSNVVAQNQGGSFMNKETGNYGSHSHPSLEGVRDRDIGENHLQHIQGGGHQAPYQAAEQAATLLYQGSNDEHAEKRNAVNLPQNSQTRFSKEENFSKRLVASQQPQSSDELLKDQFQTGGRAPDSEKSQSLPERHHVVDMKHDQFESKDSSAKDNFTQDKHVQKDQSDDRPQAEESKIPQDAGTGDTDDTSLHKDIDDDIKIMAQEVREQVYRDHMTMVHKPMDPNLVCPICGKNFRIGEIQKFRRHVDECV